MLAKPVMGGISSRFGWRTLRDRLGRSYRNFHNGLDFGWLLLHPIKSRVVYSAHPGRVVDAGSSYEPGNYVLVDIGGGKKLRYIHLSRIDVTVGQKVGYSTPIGVMGDTGASTARGQVHLHLDLFDGANRVDPEPYLTLPFGHTGPTLSTGGSKPTPIPTLPESLEDDMNGFYIEASSAGAKYYYSPSSGKVRQIPSDEWAFLRAVESTRGGIDPIKVVTVSQNWLNKALAL